MRRGLITLTALALGVALGLWRPAVAEAADRVALVLAAETYEKYPKSLVAADSGRAIAEALKKQGFDVVVALNPNNAGARAAVRDFVQRSEQAQVALAFIAGHGVTTAGRTYFLPVNAEISRETDLLSRGVAVSSLLQVVSKARNGGIFFLMTAADISAAVPSATLRPGLGGEVPSNVFVVFSTSDKVPVSRIDTVTQKAVADLVAASSRPTLSTASLASAASAGGLGRLFGQMPDIDLTKRLNEPKVAADAGRSNSADVAARRDAEQRARLAEEQLRTAERRVREAEDRAKAAGQVSVARPEPPAAQPSADVETLKLLEAQFGPAQKKRIQLALRAKKFYLGPIDALFLELTRQSIVDYQKSLSAEPTGYLTPQQLKSLIGG